MKEELSFAQNHDNVQWLESNITVWEYFTQIN
jgi:hypothetical protein